MKEKMRCMNSSETYIFAFDFVSPRGSRGEVPGRLRINIALLFSLSGSSLNALLDARRRRWHDIPKIESSFNSVATNQKDLNLFLHSVSKSLRDSIRTH